MCHDQRRRNRSTVDSLFCKLGTVYLRRLKAVLDVDIVNMVKDTLRLCTYNVLADKYATKDLACVPEVVKWENRGPRIVEALERISPDLLFLQEVEESVFKMWRSHFRTLGYKGTSVRQARIGRVVVAAEILKHIAS